MTPILPSSHGNPSDALVVRPEQSTRLTDPESPESFSSLVADMLNSAELDQDQVSHQIQRVITGETSNIHDVSLAIARADLSFRFLMQIRDQLIGAYREVMRMQV